MATTDEANGLTGFHEMVDLSNQRRITLENSMPITAEEAKAITDAVYAFNQNAYDNALKMAYAAIRKAAQDGKSATKLANGVWYNGDRDPKTYATYIAAADKLRQNGFKVNFIVNLFVTEVSW